jgi:hypothetical protein
VRSYGYIEGMRLLRVRGYGVVGGLPGTGGTDCPDVIRDYLAREIRRQNSARDLEIQPTDVLESTNFAPVVVTAEIPAASMKHDRFDVVLRALGNQTESLEGGHLMFCDLKLFASTPRGIIEGKTVGYASGPVYISPFGADPDAATPGDSRLGRVLGGGIAREDRRLRIILNQPNYSVANRIGQRLNGRFGSSKRVADPVSPTTIHLDIPDEYRDEPRHFIDLVLHTPVDGSPAEVQRKAAALAEEFTHPQAAYEDIAVVFEAIGRTALSSVKRLYTHRNEATSYYAARTGLRMGDDLALDVVAQHAGNRESPFQEAAVGALAGAARTMHRAAAQLRILLSNGNNRIRIAAYEGLLHRHDQAIETMLVGDRSFFLDRIDCEGDPLVYVRQSETPRVALFGRRIFVKENVLYDREDQLVMISGRPGQDDLTVVRKNPFSGKLSDPLPASRDLAELIQFLGGVVATRPDGGVTALGLPYSVVVAALYDMSVQTGSIPGTLIRERPRLADAAARTVTRERPESEF